ncbi:MAG: trypsin-like peptidase domain-containing protein [Aureliella sp.]
MASWILPAFLVAFAGGGATDCKVLHFTAGWCQPCQQMTPTVDQLRADGWQIQAVDTDQYREAAVQYRVENLPTFVIISGGREVDRIVGVASYQVLSRRVERAARHAGHRANTQQPQPMTAQAAAARQPAQQRAFADNSFSGATNAPSHASAPASGIVIRGQSDTIQPTVGTQPVTATQQRLTPQQAIARAADATVRIRVDEPNSTAFGTGTVVHTHGQEALVLTCGHLFRNMTPGSQLTVDLFVGGSPTTVPARLVDFKADPTTEDIGLISFALPFPIQPVSIAPRSSTLVAGQPVFSFGCDHGDDPTRRDTKITHINRYLGPANIEISGAPAVGRSGGGLFDMEGNLIGVCNAADETDDEGIYAAMEVVHAQLARLGLDRMVAPAASAVATAAAEEPASMPQASVAHAIATTPATQVQPGAVEQVVCIIRDASGVERKVTIDRPSADLVARIARDATR